MGLFNIFNLLKNDEKRVGLTQFGRANYTQKPETTQTYSIQNKNVKLSDLMRRSGSY